MRRPRPVPFAALAALTVLGTVPALADSRPKPRKPKPSLAATRAELAATVATDDAVAACRAAIAAATTDPAGASFALPTCDAAVATEPALEAAARQARIAVARAARADDWSPVELVLRPEGAEATLSIDAFVGLPVPAGRVMLPAGRYRISARNEHGEVSYDLALGDGARAMVLVEVPTVRAAATHGVVDFGDGEPAEPPVAGPPPKIRRESLLPERFRRGATARPGRR